MSDLVCYVISCCVEAAIQVKSMNMTKLWQKTRKKIKYGN